MFGGEADAWDGNLNEVSSDQKSGKANITNSSTQTV